MDRPTLRALLARRDLALRPIGEIDDDALDRTLRWVHSSDLADPAPFLDDGVALLTTGTQFTGVETATADGVEARADGAPAGSVGFVAYVDRLVARGVAALGFGTEVVRAGVPDGLVSACGAAGLPLFEVPFRTPFIAVARANAEALAAEGYARRSWALAAQRAISLAALRPDALGATLAELARQLGTWVGLFDATSELTHSRPARLPQPVAHALGAEVSRILAPGVRAAETIELEGRGFQLQTLGRGGRLRGVLAVEQDASDRLDQEARGVITTVVAMAGFALEQREELSRARSALRVGALRALLRGDRELAEDVAEAWGGLPAVPLTVGVIRAAPDALLPYLELRAERLRGRVFFAARADDEVVVIAGRGAPDVFSEIADRFAVPVGVAQATDVADVGRGLDRALAALAGAGPGVSAYEPAAAGVLEAMGPLASAAARALLQPLDAEPGGAELRRALHTWLERDARIEDAARVLGIHRHTMRARLARAEALLGRDLSSFAARAELWTALVATAH